MCSFHASPRRATKCAQARRNPPENRSCVWRQNASPGHAGDPSTSAVDRIPQVGGTDGRRSSSGMPGSVNENVVPSPTLLCTHIRPPCDSTIPLAM